MRPHDEEEKKVRSAAQYGGMSAETRRAVWRGIEEQMKKELAIRAGAEDVRHGAPRSDRGKVGAGAGSKGARAMGGIGARRWYRPGALGTGAAVVAAVAIVAGGFWAASQGGLLGHGTTRVSGSGAGMSATNAAVIRPVGNSTGLVIQPGGVPLRLSSSWSQITVADNSAVPIDWSPIVFIQTESRVQSMLQGAIPVRVAIPDGSNGASGAGAYIGPSQLELGNGKQTMTIEPAYYFAGSSSNSAASEPSYSEVLVRYINGVIAVTTGKQTNDYRDAAMYDWLKNHKWKSEFQTGINAINTRYSDAQLAAMTPTKLAAYNMQHGSPLPFAGGNMVRNVPSQLLLVSDPKSGSILSSQYVQATPGVDAGTTHSVILAAAPSDQFQVVDRWTGSVGSQQGVAIEVDRKTDGSEYIVAIARGPRENVYSFPAQVLITNFTGSYMVFSAENNHFYALNLQTGSLIQGTMAAQMSSDYRSIGSTIVGLPKSYAAQPVIGGKRY